jgi:hypothetical protein
MFDITSSSYSKDNEGHAGILQQLCNRYNLAISIYFVNYSGAYQSCWIGQPAITFTDNKRPVPASQHFSLANFEAHFEPIITETPTSRAFNQLYLNEVKLKSFRYIPEDAADVNATSSIYRDVDATMLSVRDVDATMLSVRDVDATMLSVRDVDATSSIYRDVDATHESPVKHIVPSSVYRTQLTGIAIKRDEIAAYISSCEQELEKFLLTSSGDDFSSLPQEILILHQQKIKAHIATMESTLDSCRALLQVYNLQITELA